TVRKRHAESGCNLPALGKAFGVARGHIVAEAVVQQVARAGEPGRADEEGVGFGNGQRGAGKGPAPEELALRIEPVGKDGQPVGELERAGTVDRDVALLWKE